MTPYVAAYLAAIVAANLAIAHFGPAAAPVVALLFVGLDLTLRDRLHDAWRYDHLFTRMGVLIAAGSLISGLVSIAAVPVAVASMIAFAAAAAADGVTYHALRHHSWWVRVNGSNVVGAAVDSVVFPTMAFGVWLPAIIAAQFGAKVIGGAAWAAILRRRR